MANLMIVESPTKAAKIRQILGGGWIVEASVGHIADLPNGKIAIEPGSYKLEYQLSDRGKSVVGKLKGLADSAHEVYLATDPDREGEAISAHLRHYLRLTSYKRVTFNEITETGVRGALSSPRQIDKRLVDAQEARRAADRLIGYRVSYPISNAAGMALSAGRCQSPAVRLVVERQDEIDNFKVTDHFTAVVQFDNGEWTAEWQTKPFLTGESEYILDRGLAERAANCRDFAVSASNQKPAMRAPGAPFTTSALLQAAGATLKLPPAITQACAQKLFENGHITYHRTDNPNLSDDGMALIAAYAQQRGWPLSEKKRRWKLPEGAQEAHEAIRPTHPEVLDAGENDNEKAVYRLIWRRAIASQLADAEYNSVTLDLAARQGTETFQFRAKSAVLVKPGWKVVASDDDKDDDEDDDNAASSGKVPVLQAGQGVRATGGQVVPKATKPPARYTETSLIKKLEAMGIGRPSTFAAIVQNICGKGYVKVEKRFLAPTPAGRAIVRQLVGRFGFAEYDFTKELETQLDLIADGKSQYVPVVHDLNTRLDGELGKLEADTPSYPCPRCGKPLRLARSKKGRSYFGCTGYRDGCEVLCEDNNGQPGPIIALTPSEKQLELARKLAAEQGISIPDEALSHSRKLREWIDGALVNARPSEKQIEFARKLAADQDSTVPEAALATAPKLKAWIDAALANARPSDKQIEFAQKIAAEKGSAVPEDVLASATKLRTWIDKALKGSKRTKRAAGGKR
ncbi:DNA topoisomerase [Brucella sp. NBRC 113783]|nr:DNA topoisomerase [Brucella sp. NBRC 113783]MDX4076594.1 DNA topoisomerase [Brucella sp. NBRC 113783]